MELVEMMFLDQDYNEIRSYGLVRKFHIIKKISNFN